MKKVLLITMPFASIKWPSLGISLLKPRLSEEGIACDIKYFNIVFAKMIGLDIYEEIAIYPQHMRGERLFAQEYFAEQLPKEEEYRRYFKKVYQGFGEDDNSFYKIFSTKKFIKPFLDHCIKSTSWGNYDVVGFTTMFEQNLASIALAHQIKLLDSTKIIIFGGANCEEEMGLELHKRFPFIDYICSGEADYSFPEVIKRIANQQSVQDLSGIIHRKNGESIMTQGSPIIKNLDALPYPDYEDYFTQLEQAGFPPSVCYELHMETSRGCWWGSKSQCNFCGLNAHSIIFRSKSKDRIIAELNYIIEKYIKRYNLTLVSMVDNILNMNYFKDLLPELKEKRLPVNLFYEVKANLNKEHVQMLSEAGIIWIQPGIESLNTHVLKLMDKGVSALQNIRLLKYCRQFNVYPSWNLIYRLPGEKEEDYKQMLDLIYKITHLIPPQVVIPLCLHRFSPYFANPKEYGIINVRPESAYRFIYPFEESSIFNLAYFFEFDYRNDVKPPNYNEELAEAVDYWKECYANNETLYSIETSPSTLLIEDRRSNAIVSQTILESTQRDIYEYCDKIQNFSSIFSYIQEKYSSYPVRARDIKDFLEDMVDLNLMVSENNNYLSLAIPFNEKASSVENSS